MNSRKKANAAKNKAMKKEVYDILARHYRTSAGDGDREWNGQTLYYNVGPFRAHTEVGGGYTINLDGKMVCVTYSSTSGKYHWLGAIPNDRDLMKLRLYV